MLIAKHAFGHDCHAMCCTEVEVQRSSVRHCKATAAQTNIAHIWTAIRTFYAYRHTVPVFANYHAICRAEVEWHRPLLSGAVLDAARTTEDAATVGTALAVGAALVSFAPPVQVRA